MRVHHLNCGTMRPLAAGRLGYATPRMVCHCLLIEARDGLVLVDTGLGSADCAAPRGRLGAAFLALTRPALDPAETAQAQLRRLGFDPADVRHVVLTHLDLDHVGGLADFPNARAHVWMVEHEAAVLRTSARERARYREVHVDGFARWTLYTPRGERWKGFEAVRGLQGLSDEVLLLPLVGHTRGHGGVAVPVDGGWVLHAGDAYFHRRELEDRAAPLPLEALERYEAMDRAARLQNRARLAELARAPDVRVFCSHDPDEFDALASRSPG